MHNFYRIHRQPFSSLTPLGEKSVRSSAPCAAMAGITVIVIVIVIAIVEFQFGAERLRLRSWAR
jgi:hypothetical protein